jgi:hypothetical protein
LSSTATPNCIKSYSNVQGAARVNAARWRVLLPCVAAAIAGTLLSVEAWQGSRLREERLAEFEFNARSEDAAEAQSDRLIWPEPKRRPLFFIATWQSALAGLN